MSANGRRDETAGRGADHPKSGPGDLEPKVRVIDNCILPPSPTYMPARYPLLVHPRARAKRPTFDQERFAFLLEQIERARAAQAGRESLYAGFRRDHAAILSPLRQRLRATCRDTVFALDRLLDQRGWSRAEQSILVDMLRATTTALLETGTHDEEVKHIYDKYHEVTYDRRKQQELDLLKEQAQAMGFDLGAANDIRNEDDLAQRMYENLADRAGADEQRRAERHTRKTAPNQRKEDSAKLARQALRELYRKLASLVHPDRESDAARREQKNLLMQEINHAYAANDLMTLFEVQMRLERSDPERIARLNVARLKQYNKLLSEQLTALNDASDALEEHFRAEFGLSPLLELTADNLSQVLRHRARAMRAEITRQEQLLEILADKTVTKRWLRAHRFRSRL
ncbi:MAG: J domain-containing protein [Gammaproteobacteria bacterium]